MWWITSHKLAGKYNKFSFILKRNQRVNRKVFFSLSKVSLKDNWLFKAKFIQHNNITYMEVKCLTAITIWIQRVEAGNGITLLEFTSYVKCYTITWRCVLSASIMSNSLWPCGPWPARLLCPWDSLGKNTGVGSHFLLQIWCKTSQNDHHNLFEGKLW